MQRKGLRGLGLPEQESQQGWQEALLAPLAATRAKGAVAAQWSAAWLPGSAGAPEPAAESLVLGLRRAARGLAGQVANIWAE